MNNQSNHPAQLWISDHQTLENKMIAYLQKKLCSNNGCLDCINCKQILEKEHPWVTWVSPERSYSVEQIDEVIAAAGFQLDDHESRFFIFTQAERLTDQCSNRLLKTIEEPFAGYHFFFLTRQIQALPLTIQSRCIIQKYKEITNFELYKKFLQPFLELRFNEPIEYIKQLDTFDIKEHETKELTDDLFAYWSEKMKHEIISNTERQETKQIVSILQHAIINQPMSGSSKIFWKNLYMNIHYAVHSTKTKN